MIIAFVILLKVMSKVKMVLMASMKSNEWYVDKKIDLYVQAHSLLQIFFVKCYVSAFESTVCASCIEIVLLQNCCQRFLWSITFFSLLGEIVS